MKFEKQILSVLKNEVGSDACNSILLSADMDNDGWNDIVICGNAGRLAIVKNGERYSRWSRFIIDENISAATAAALYDLTDSGCPDILLACGSGEVVWYMNPGKIDGKWEKHTAFTAQGEISDILPLENLMGDGKKGLLMTCAGDEGTSVLYAALPQNALEPWEQPVVLAADLMDQNKAQHFTAPSEGLAAADLNGDGHMEFVCGNYWFEKSGDGFTAHAYCEDKVCCRIALGDVDGRDELALIACERNAIDEYELEGASLSIYRPGIDPTALWEEQVLSSEINDCGLLLTGKFSGGRNADIIVGEIGQEGLTRSLCTFKKPAHLGGFDFSNDTTRYLSRGKTPVIRLFRGAGDSFEEQIVSADGGMYAGSLSNVMHNGHLSLIGAPKLGSERWSLQCFTLKK